MTPAPSSARSASANACSSFIDSNGGRVAHEARAVERLAAARQLVRVAPPSRPRLQPARPVAVALLQLAHAIGQLLDVARAGVGRG